MWCYYSRLRITLYPVQEEVDVVLLPAANFNTVSRSGVGRCCVITRGYD